MRVRMNVNVSGVRDGQPWPNRGEEVEVGDQEGADLCAAGIAEPVAASEPVEKAVTAKAETRRKARD